MRKLSPCEAARMGPLGGKVTGATRIGDRDWGQRMRRQRGARTQQRCYPSLWRLWLNNARRTKADLPLLPVPLVDTPAALAAREARRLRKRREDYGRDHGTTVVGWYRPRVSPRPMSFLSL